MRLCGMYGYQLPSNIQWPSWICSNFWRQIEKKLKRKKNNCMAQNFGENYYLYMYMYNEY